MHVCIFTHMRMRMNTQVCWRGQACTLVANIQNAAVKKTVGNFLALNILTSRRIYAQRGRDRRTYACAHKRTHAHTHTHTQTCTHRYSHAHAHIQVTTALVAEQQRGSGGLGPPTPRRCVCVCVCVCVFVCVCVCVCVSVRAFEHACMHRRTVCLLSSEQCAPTISGSAMRLCETRSTMACAGVSTRPPPAHLFFSLLLSPSRIVLRAHTRPDTCKQGHLRRRAQTLRDNPFLRALIDC